MNYTPGNWFPFIPDLSLAYLAAALKRAGHLRKVFDSNPLTGGKDRFFQSIKKDVPDVIGFKITDNSCFSSTVEMAKVARKISPSSLIIAGGPHATLCQESLLEVTDVFDLAVIGEGELTLVELGDYLDGGRDLKDVRNITFRNGGKLETTENKPIENLDDLPLPDWEVFDLENYFPMLMISMQRGCAYNCSFCVSKYLWSGVRRRSLDSVRNELDTLAEKFEVFRFCLTDPTPSVGLLLQVCDYIEKKGFPFIWYGYGNVGAFKKVDYERLSRAGCRALLYGIESGDSDLLKKMGKNFSLSEVAPSLRQVQDAGIWTLVSFIAGFPGETTESMTSSLELIAECRCDEFSIEPFKLQPGTAIAQHPARYGVTLDPDFREKYAVGNTDNWKIGRVGGTRWGRFWFNRYHRRCQSIEGIDMNRFKLTLHFLALIAPLLDMKEESLLKLWRTIWNPDNPDLTAIKEVIAGCWKASRSLN